MNKLLLKIIICCCLLLPVSSGFAQVAVNEVPMVGAEVFIEPGQSPADIDTWFKRMQESGMTITRIRMFESYMHKPDGSWDYTLFDYAFKAGEKYHIKIYANLFPATAFEDVGGFKFPRSEAHLQSIGVYIKNLANHFKQFTSLYGWVPVNEPGSGHYPRQDFSQAKFNEWKKLQPVAAYQSNGYTHFDFSDDIFLLDYNAWFLNWLADEIHKYDAARPIHVNNHAIFKNAAEYDFSKWRKFLTSLGGSAHASWHFDYFKRNEYVMALSANSEILRSGAGNIPWLMTELQGGNNTYSGYQAMCPTAAEVSQWLWTTIASGSKGAIFWCLNPRMSGIEAGEWAMLDYLNNPSDRMRSVSKSIKAINANAQLFANATVDESGINVLYIRESMWVESRLASTQAKDYEARKQGAVMKSAIAYYEALSQMGLQTNFKEIAEFDFDKTDYAGKTVILANQIAVPSVYKNKLQNFVSKGGKLIVEGATAYYDEHAVCMLSANFPFKDLFGGLIKEYKMRDNLFQIKLNGYKLPIPAHGWQGYIQPVSGTVLGNYGSEAVAVKNKYGRGEVLWIPSMLGLGSRAKQDYLPLSEMLNKELLLNNSPKFYFNKLYKGMFLKTLRFKDQYIMVIINKSGVKQNISVAGSHPGIIPSIIYQSNGGYIHHNIVSIGSEGTLILKWVKQ